MMGVSFCSSDKRDGPIVRFFGGPDRTICIVGAHRTTRSLYTRTNHRTIILRNEALGALGGGWTESRSDLSCVADRSEMVYTELPLCRLGGHTTFA